MKDDLISRQAAIDAIDANNGTLYDNPTLVASLHKLLSELPSATDINVATTDTISRRDAVEAMAELQGRAASKGELTGISKAWKRIKALPTVDVVPARHGRWKMVEGELAFWDMCSACGRKIVHRTPYYDFCPNCGARMDGKDSDGNG